VTQPDITQLCEALHAHVVHVQFVKADGSVRIMQATLQEQLVPASDHTTSRTALDPHLFKVWDMEKQAWRSFRSDRLVSWQIYS
jgi:hypothetical protein